MAQADRAYPNMNADEFNRAPPPPGSYYNVKEQHLPAPATYRGVSRGRSGCCSLLLCLCGILTFLVVSLALTVLIFWLVVHPKAPRIDIQNVHIDGLSSLSSSNTSTVSTNITFEIKAQNPNKHMGIYYDDINVDLQAQGASVGGGSIPSFYQGHRNTTNITGNLISQNLPLSSDTQKFLSSTPSSVPLYAKVDLNVRVKVGSITSSKIKVKVRCDLTVDLLTSGSQLKTENCKVKW